MQGEHHQKLMKALVFGLEVSDLPSEILHRHRLPCKKLQTPGRVNQISRDLPPVAGRSAQLYIYAANADTPAHAPGRPQGLRGTRRAR